MAEPPRKDTALGVARARFVDGLGRKASELRGAIALLAGAPSSERSREEMRRRLHALYASAQVFRIDALADSLKEAIRRLDAARDEKRALTQEDLDAIATLAAELPAMGASEARVEAPAAQPSPAAGVSLPRPPGARAAPRPAEAAPPPAPPRPASDAPPPATVPAPAAVPRLDGSRAVRPSGSFTASRPGTSPAPTSAGQTMPPPRAQAVVSVLVIDTAEAQAQVRAALPVDGFEVIAAASPEEGLRLARSTAPDVVLVDRQIAVRGGVEIVARLRNDPLTDFVPVVLLIPQGQAIDAVAVRELGADDALAKPLDAGLLWKTIARLTQSSDGAGWIDSLGDQTVEGVADRLAAEIRRGLVESTESGATLAVPLGDGAEVMAAAWAAIARVRAHLAQRSGGRLRFRDAPQRGGPALLALVDDDTPETDDAGAPVSLRDRRIVVADDDPAIVWFFAGLLREEGAEVVEAADGREALQLARERRPDVVISDILMPHVDGFALTREMKRDPSLSDVPVILLSWKEDFLTRMRELQSGASGYLRKEAGAQQILSRVRDVLRPRARLELQLRAGGEVRGGLDRVGIFTLLTTVARERPDSRVTVRDAYNLFETDLRGGDLFHLTKTATDGSFARGAKALLPLLGVTGGRFTIVDAESTVRRQFEGSLARVLDRGVRELGALIDSVSGTGLSQAAFVTLDEDVLEPLLHASPEPMREVVEKLRAGEGPRALLVNGVVPPQVLEGVLVDLARRGALKEVRGPGGDDNVAEALKLRTEAPGALLASQSRKSSAPPPAIEEAPSATAEEGAPASSWLAEIERVTEAKTAKKPAPEVVPEEDEPILETAPSADSDADESFDEDEAQADSTATSTSVAPTGSDVAPAEPAEDGLPEELLEADGLPPSEPPPAITPAPPPPRPEPPPAPSKPAAVAPPKSPAPPVAPTPPPRSSGATWLFVLVVAALLGGGGWYLWSTGALGGRAPTPTPGTATAADAGVGTETTTDAGAPVLDAGPTEAPAAETEGDELPPEALRFGRVVESIVDAGVRVEEGQGLILVETSQGSAEARVTVDDREVGAAPVRMAVPEGMHEIGFRRGDESSFRYLNVRAGTTVIVEVPAP